MKIVTHSGRFHVDDVFAVATALLVYPDSEVIRTRDEKIIESSDIVIDVGFVYDPKRKRFDHHQRGGAGGRENGIPYSSFGLVWKEWGKELSGEEESQIIDQKLVCPIDANDNGISVGESKFPGIREYTIYDVITSYSDEADFSEEVLLQKFLEAVSIAQSILKREITLARKEIADTKEVESLVKSSTDKNIIVLNKSLLWVRALSTELEVTYVVYPRKDNTWGAQTVSQDILNNFFKAKKPFPQSWGGKTNDELAKISGVKDAIFCHSKLFLCVARSKEGALMLAKKALDA